MVSSEGLCEGRLVIRVVMLEVSGTFKKWILVQGIGSLGEFPLGRINIDLGDPGCVIEEHVYPLPSLSLASSLSI
jgi:hypothetical protein